MAGQSKCLNISTTCREYIHPWVQNCTFATCGLGFVAFKDCLRIYSMVYAGSLVMRRRLPSPKDLWQTFLGILRSSAFLSTAAWGFPAWACALRKLFGFFNVYTAAFIPCFLTSIMAISIERPSRRPLLSLYVANVGGETFWRMLEERGLVKSTRLGQILLFGVSTSILTYFYRRGWHTKVPKESIFNGLKYVVGDIGIPSEQVRTEKPRKSQQEGDKRWPGGKFIVRYGVVALLVKYYNMMVEKMKKLPKNKCCPHQDSCISYCVGGGLKLFGTGLGIQIALKFVFQFKRLLKKPKILFSKETFHLALFLGSFSAIFRTISCILRSITKTDDPKLVFPAILAASSALKFYPDNTATLYIMWKCLQTSFVLGVDRGYWKSVPYFTEFFYCFWTSIIFHAALLEPTTIRGSYWKFLMGLSGGRIAAMDRVPLDQFGLDTKRKLHQILDKTNTKININYTW